MAFDSILALLSQPLVGIALGVSWALLLLRNSKSSFARMTPEAPAEGLLFIVVSLFGRLALTTAVLWAYSRFVPGGFPPFALSMAVGFLSLFGVEAIRYAELPKRWRPRAGAAKGGR